MSNLCHSQRLPNPSIKPSHSLEICTFLCELLLRDTQVGANRESVLGVRIQSRLESNVLCNKNCFRSCSLSRCICCIKCLNLLASHIYHPHSSSANKNLHPKAILNGPPTAAHSSVLTLLGCAVNPASNPLPGAKNLATYFPPKQYPTAPILLAPN
jgi:hypothetical protein